MSLPANKQAFLDQLRNYALVPQDPVHLDLFLELLDKYVAGLEESSGSNNEPDPNPPQEAPSGAIFHSSKEEADLGIGTQTPSKPSLLDRVNNLMSKKPEDSDVSK